MLKAGLGSCQRLLVAGRGSPKAPAASAGSPAPQLLLLPSAPSSSPSLTSSPFKCGPLAASHAASSSPVFGRYLLPPCTATVSTADVTSTAPKTASSTKQHHHQANGNGHSNGYRHTESNGNGSGYANGNGNGRSGKAAAAAATTTADLHDEVVLRDAATTVRVHIVVPRCSTVPGEHLVLVGDSEALGGWDVSKGVRLHWCTGHMHTATIAVPLGQQLLKAKLVMVHGHGSNASFSWEAGQDRSIALQPPQSTSTATSSSSSSSNGSDRAPKDGKAALASARGTVSHDYVAICHWGHTEATSVLAREVPGEVLMLEQQLSKTLSELRTARNTATSSQEKLQRMAQDLAAAERAARQSAEQFADLQAKHSAAKTDLSEAKRELTDVKRQAKAAATEAAAAAAKASTVNVAEVEARVSQRYEGRLSELKQQLEGVKIQYSSEVLSLQQKLEASLSKETEAQEMVKTLREIVQRDVARLRTELAQLVNEYIAARQQLQDQAQQIEASEKLRMQQIDGLSSEIKNLITKYNGAQQTIVEQQRLLEELQGSRGGPLPGQRVVDQVQHMAVPPSPDSQAGRGWRADWARLSKISANSTPAAASNSR